MRCPKCHYISFDSGDRCRNCGYDFSLTVDVRDPDLPIHTDEPLGPMSDLRLGGLDGPAARPAPHKVWEPAPEPEPDEAAAQLPARAAQPRRPVASSPFDLPLFTGPHDDAPLVTPQAVPRPPLAVRRAAAPAIKPKPHPAEPSADPVLDLGIPEPIAPVPAAQYAPEGLRPASLTRRLIAGVIDVSILGSIDTVVLYFTLGLCGLRLVEAALIPVVPFGAFLLLLNGGYVVGFTAAAGQTVGKMATGIRVVPACGERPERVPFGVAVVRAAAYLVSVLPAGLGFIPAVLGPEHRAVHDRLADTRVVRA